MIDYTTYLILRRAKIVATIGLASNSEEVLRELIIAGMNIARLNFSHGDHQQHLEVIQKIRKISKQLGIHVAILGDLGGPKIRVGQFENGEIELIEDEQVIVTTDKQIGTSGIIPSQYSKLIEDMEIGKHILLDDGKLEIKVVAIESTTKARCQVIRGGTLKDKKGMNFPGSALSIPALTEKDYVDLKFCVQQRVDYLALSFVRKASEIIDLKQKIQELLTTDETNDNQAPIHVIAKIEKPEALTEIEDIIKETDAIMVARGDLGVEMALQKVPIVQAHLIKLCNEQNKPVIVATQMLESMIENARPTRAEVNDVASAALENADAVMLSGETASGKYPVESVKFMDSVLREVEAYRWSQKQFGKLQSDADIYSLPYALARAATLLSQDLEIRALNIFTETGLGARLMSSSRPNAPILAYCRDQRIVNQMLLYWGVMPILVEQEMKLEKFTEFTNQTVKEMKLAEQDQWMLLVSPITEKKQTTTTATNKEKKVHSLILYQVF